MNVKRTITSAVMLLAAVTMMTAQEGGKAALPFTRIDRNPRTGGMAGAGMASVSQPGAYSAFRGAAALPFLKGTADGALSLQLWEPANEVDKTTNIQGGAALHFGSFGVAIGGAFQGGVPVGGYTPSDRLVGLGLSYAMGSRISVGLNARYAAQSFAQNASVNGFSADLTVLGRITESLSATLGVCTLGSSVIASDGTPFGQPSYVLLGIDWISTFSQVNTVELALDAEYNFDGTFGAAIGAEYAYKRMVFVRAGYRAAAQYAVIPSHLALGLGFQYAGFRLDASFLTASPLLGNTLHVGIGYTF